MLHVLKFGGTSLKDAECIDRAVNIVKKHNKKARTIVVVSAIGGVTDQLLELTDRGSLTDQELIQGIETLKMHHLSILRELTGPPGAPDRHVIHLIDELEENLKNRPEDPQEQKAWQDLILSYGERLSAYIFSTVLGSKKLEARSYEAHQFVRTNQRFGEAEVCSETTRNLIRQHFQQPNGHIPVITGFIGGTDEEKITTLGRSGSDYTAGLVAEALRADRLEIWTDVDGVLTADPKIVPTAQTLQNLNYEDIEELSRHGAKVIHPKTVSPLHELNIPLKVKNSFNPKHPGTLITADYPSNGNFRSVSFTGPYIHLDIQSNAEESINSIVDASVDQLEDGQSAISHIKSRHNELQISLILKPDQYERIQTELESASERDELSFKTEKVYQLKIFNNSLKNNSRLLQQALKILDAKQINPVEIRHAAGRRFASLFVKEDKARLAARLINDHICIDDKRIDVFVAGVGAIGGTLLEQINNLENDDLTIKIIGICNSKSVVWNERGLHPAEAVNKLSHKGQHLDWDSLLNRITDETQHNTIFVDATGSAEVAHLYPHLLDNGIHIATPSKIANTFEQEFYDKLHQLKSDNNAYYEYETTVGAALPLLDSIRNLVRTGDQITFISGVVSGSLNYIFDELDKGTPFSEAVVQAREKGYAEPDPRDDLSGEDVARKFLILARMLGYSIEREELSVESLIPDELVKVERSEFLEALHQYDEVWKEKFDEARSRNETLRYVGKLEDGNISVGIRSVPRDSSLGQLKGTDNLVQIFSKRYATNPLIIQGPGAGKDVTAAGVLADILKIGSIITQ